MTTTTTTTWKHPRSRASVSAVHNHRADGERAAQRLARITGLLYLLIAVLGMFAGTISTGLVVTGDAAATAGKVLASAALVRGSLAAWIVDLAADLAVAVTLFVLLKPVSATLSRLAAALRVAYVAVQGLNLINLFNALVYVADPSTRAGVGAEQADALALSSLVDFGVGFKVGLIVFGAHLVVLGWLLVASGFVPRVIGVLVVAAGLGYATSSLAQFFLPGASDAASAALLASAAIGELALTGWLLVKGIRVRPDPAGAATSETLSTRSAASESDTALLVS